MQIPKNRRFVKENYGDDSQYAGIFKDIGRASTGKDVREVRQKAADTFLTNQAGDRMEKALLGATMGNVSGYKVVKEGSFFSQRRQQGNIPMGTRPSVGFEVEREAIEKGFNLLSDEDKTKLLRRSIEMCIYRAGET